MPLSTVDFLGIGAQRAGTTWLFRCLRRHPQLWLPAAKELHYFDRLAGLGPLSTEVVSLWRGLVGAGPAEREWRLQAGRAMWSVLRRGPSVRTARELVRTASFHRPGPKDDAWYRRQFTGGAGRVKGEITPTYAQLGDAGVAHALAMFPDLKVIFLLREPVSRMVSQWRLWSRDAVAIGLSPPLPSPQFFALPKVRERNDYLRTIDTWGAHVPPERFFIGWYDDIVADPEGMLRRVMTFLGVDPDEPRVLNAAATRDLHPPAAEAVIPSDVLLDLARSARPGIAALAERLGGHAVGWLERCDALLAGADPIAEETPPRSRSQPSARAD